MDVDLLNLIMLLVFVGGLVFAIIKISSRRLRYYFLGEPPPALMTRDLVMVTGLAFPFLAILLVRTINSFFPDLGLSALLAGNAVWYLVTGLPAILAVLAFDYYEQFRIERK